MKRNTKIVLSWGLALIAVISIGLTLPNKSVDKGTLSLLEKQAKLKSDNEKLTQQIEELTKANKQLKKDLSQSKRLLCSFGDS